MKVDVIVDSLQYARSNCYVHQLLATLDQRCSVRYYELADVRSGSRLEKGSDRTLSLLKLRTIHRELDAVESFLDGTRTFFYEQDVWESFRDESPFKGTYDTIKRRMNLATFLTTSSWWSNFVVSRGIPSKFVRMWMLPQYCSAAPKFSDRKIDVGFCGTLHPYRRELFEGLRSRGIDVTITPQVDYRNYLATLSQMKVFVHSENFECTVDGEKISASPPRIKDIEAAARGCFSMRSFDDQVFTYGCESIETIRPFEDLDSLVTNIRSVLDRDPTRNDEAIQQGVEEIKSQGGWSDVIRALHETL